MSAASERPAKTFVSRIFRGLARSYVKLHKPTVIAVGGSIGKTSTKLMLAKVLETEKTVSCMDDSYNTGLGLYLSVFQLKVPRSVWGWSGKLLAALWRLLTTHKDILILEYGIDGVGDMDEMVGFIRPHISVLTAVTPEHMEFLKDIDTVGAEETKILAAASEFGVVNAVDVDEKYLTHIREPLLRFGRVGDDASYEITEWNTAGTKVEFHIEDETMTIAGIHIISEPLIRQLSGVLLTARRLGVSSDAMMRVLPSLRSAAGRMNLLEGVHDSMIIDDTANFSPVAGVAALRTLKRMEASRRIAVLGNMHELGDFADEGYAQVADEFNGIDTLVLVGDLSTARFGKLAQEHGFVQDKNLFYKDTSLDAGEWLRDTFLKSGDVVLAKGPFGGWYIEETVRLILRDPSDVQYVTRQSDFWHTKKRAHFGDHYNIS